jgi:hypothetical protein
MMKMKDVKFSVHFKDKDDKDHVVEVTAHSGTHAILLAMEEVHDLKLHPNRIYRVTKED